MNAFDSIIGYESIKEELFQIADTLKNKDIYEELGVSSPRGLMLTGMPGVGKSTMAYALAKESGRKLFLCRKTKANDAFVDEITDTFQKAEKAAPSIVFLDDLDKFANEDNDHRDAEEYVTVQACIDNLKGKEVFVLATVNNRRKLPNSLCRPGRFDRTLRIDPPSKTDAVLIMQHYLKKKKMVTDVDMALIAAMLRGDSCATLETVINEAGLIAGYQRSDVITQDHIIEACMRCVFDVPAECIKGGEKISLSSRSEAAKLVWHEAGHAVVKDVLDEGSVALISARRKNGSRSGFIISGSDGSGDTLRQCRAEVMTRLGGKAAVEVQFGMFDMGTCADLDGAFRTIFKMIGDTDFAGFHLHDTGYFSCQDSDESLACRKTAASTLMKEYYQKTKELLITNREYLEKLASELAEKGILISTDIARIRSTCTIVPMSI